MDAMDAMDAAALQAVYRRGKTGGRRGVLDGSGIVVARLAVSPLATSESRAETIGVRCVGKR